MKITTAIHRVGNDSRVNSYLVEEGGQITIVDAALSGMYDDTAA